MTISLVQTAGTTFTTSIPERISPSWSSPTTTGNWLIAFLGRTLGTFGTITPPSGWSLVTDISNGNANLSAWSVVNAASQSGSQSWSWGDFPNAVSVVMAEYSGVATASPIDQNATNDGSSTSPSSGSITTTSASELIVCGMCQSVIGAGGGSFSTPTGGFTIQLQENAIDGPNINCNTALLDRIVSSTGTYTAGVTASTSNVWATIILSLVPVISNAPRPQPPIISYLEPHWCQIYE